MADVVTPIVPGQKPFRQPPANIEAEMALLGAMFVNNDAFYRVSDFLKPEHFSEPIHREMFDISGQLIRAGKQATPITIKTFLPEGTRIADLTPLQYAVRLASDATTIINAEDFGRAIYDLATRRELITIGEDMVNIAYDAPLDFGPSEQIEDAERRLFAVAGEARNGGGFEAFGEAVNKAIDMAARAYERDGHLSGMATGLTTLDSKMGGLQKSDLIIVAGRPGMGKTSLATNIAFNIAKAYEPRQKANGEIEAANGGVVAFFSLEMSGDQLATRIIAEQARISSAKIRRGDITQDEFDRLAEHAQDFSSAPLYIDQTGGISIGQLAARARRLKRTTGLDVMVIDYIQLMQGNKRTDNRVQEITEITTGLKSLAKELDVPIVALSQLSRQVESRDDKRPQLSDLRESGSIEQDADVVLFVYREEYYLQNREPDPGTDEFIKWEAKFEQARGKGDVIIAKQRHGPTGTVTLAFTPEFTLFADLAPEDQIPTRYE